MQQRLALALTALLLACGCATAAPDHSAISTSIGWEQFLSRHDPVWEEMPTRWFDAPFLGNGMLGTLVRQIGDRQVRWDVGRSDVHDHRPLGDEDYEVRAPEILKQGRVPIGHFVLHTVGEVTGGTIRLDLWNAEARGTLITDQGRIEWRTLVHADDMVYLVELRPSGGEAGPRGCRFEFVPEKAVSTRHAQGAGRTPQWFRDGYPPNPDPVVHETDDGITLCEQRLIAGGSTTTAWRLDREDERHTLLVTVAHTLDGSATEAATAQLQPAMEAERARWIATHRQWWHDYYPQSFVSFNDTVWESFYWIQMYKLACATRADRALIDNQGPWLQPTGWNGTWWNLNVQLSYSPVPTSGRLALGEALTHHLQDNFSNLVNNVAPEYRDDSAGITRNTSMLSLIGKVGRPGGWEYPHPDIGSEVGNLTWTCHNLYRQYRFSMDQRLLQQLLYPLLKRSINYYRHFLTAGDDGRLHLPATHSPEYGNAPDANYDLWLIRWGCRTLIELAERQDLDAEMIEVWRNILAQLVDPPTDMNGYMVGSGVGFDRSHRHWSHMLGVYPLHVVSPEDGHEEIIRTSLKRWHQFKGGLVGYSYTGGASFAALLGEGQMALDYLNGYLPYMGKSTMYYEGGNAGLPVMETPLHGAQAIQEMLLQSWSSPQGGRIRVFPAVPETWSDVVIHDLRAEGAFLISASRRGGKTQWVRIESLAGEPCVLQTDMAGSLRIAEGPEVDIERLSANLFRIPLDRGQEVVLVPGEAEPTLVVVPAPVQADRLNRFGVK
jgi:alpha-L-fucosidase 2